MLTSRKSISVFIVAFIVIFSSLFLFACEKSDPSTVNTFPVMPDTSGDQEMRVVVTFNSNGGSSVPEQNLSVNSLVQRPADPQRDNYTFQGWFIDSFFTKKWNFSSDVVTSSVVLYAGWKPTNKILLFNTDYSLNNNTITVTLPSDRTTFSLTGKVMLSDDNYLYRIFKGNSVSSVGEPLCRTNEADFSDLAYGKNEFIIYVSDSELNYVEHFLLNIYRTPVYTIRFYGLDDQPIGTVTASEGESVSMPTYSPVGYDVDYWRLDSKKIRQNEKLTVQKDSDLFAVCKQAVYSVTLDTQGGTVTQQTQKVTYGNNYQFAVPSRNGYYFLGWRTINNVELTGSNGSSLTGWYYTDVFTVYAMWEAYSYNLTQRTIVDGVVKETFTESAVHGREKTFTVSAHPVIASDDYVYYVFCGWYNGVNRLSLAPQYTHPSVESAMTVDAVWSTVTIQNVCDTSACDKDKFTVNATKESGDPALDFAVLGDYVGFVSSGTEPSHTFVNWQGDKTGSERLMKILTSADAVSLQCHWTEYTLKIVTSVATDWIISKTIGQNVAEMTAGTETPVSATESVILSVAPSTSTQLTFAGWYEDEYFSVLATENVSLDYVFTMCKADKTVYAKWIEKPLIINYLGADVDPTLVDHINVSLDYGENYCGGTFSISADVDPGYYYGGIFEDAGGTTFLTGTTIPSQSTNLYVKVTKTPFTIISNIAGAGNIAYKLSEKVNSSLLVKAQKTCSSFGKTSVFEEGIAYTDILTLSSATHNGYMWLGWYYATADTPTDWKMLTNKKDLEIKMSGNMVTYRATWKKIETDISIEVTNVSATAAAPGSAEYYSRIDGNGTQILSLLAHVNPGFCFEGWFVKRLDYDIDNVDSYVSEEKILLSYQNDLELNISELSSNYDLTTLEARFSELSNDILYLRNSSSDTQKRLTCSVDGVFDAYFTGYYAQEGVLKVSYQTLTIHIDQHAISYGTMTANELLIGCFSNVYLAGNSKNQDIGSANIPGLIRTTAGTYHSENNTVTYDFNMTQLFDTVGDSDNEYPLLFNYQTATENTTTVKPVSVTNTTTGEGQFADIINVSSYKTFVILQPQPARGNVFLYWEIFDPSKPMSTGDSDPNPYYSAEPLVYRNDIGYLSYTAHWKTINDGNAKVFAVKNIEEAGETYLSGYSEKVSRDVYNMVITFTAETNKGYLFRGWYDDKGNLVSPDPSFTFTCIDLESYFGATGYVTYQACWSEISARVVVDKVADYALTGFVGADGETYYTVLPVSDIYFNGNSGYYNGYYFIGWYTEDGELYSSDYFIENVPESSFPSKLFAKWTDTPKEVLPGSLMNFFNNIDISAFDISISIAGRGDVAYCFSKGVGGSTVVLFYAEPQDGYRFNGWFNDSAMDAENTLSLDSVYSTSLQELFYNRITNLYSMTAKVYASFVMMNNYTLAPINRTGISSEFRDSDIAVPTCKGYRISLTVTKYKFESGVKNGFAFVQWQIIFEDGSPTRNYFDPEFTDTFDSNKVFTIVATYARIINNAVDKVIENTSEQAGTVLGYGYYASSTEKRLKFIMTPNAGYVFCKIVAQSAQNTIVYVFDNNSVNWSSAGGVITAVITDDSIVNNFATSYKYTVYWQSVWQNATHFTEITEFVNHTNVYVTESQEEKSYSNGTKNYVQTYNFTTTFDQPDYSFIGWYKKVINENLTNIVYCDNSNTTSYNELAPDVTREYYCKWGKYKVSIEMSDPEQNSSPNGFSAKVDFVTEDMRFAAKEFVSEIGFAYMDKYDADLIERIIGAGYECSKVDLNAGEGGKIIYLVWKRLPVSGINTNFVTAVSLSDSSLPYRANVLFADAANASLVSSVMPVAADLNYGTGGAPIYCYYSFEAGYGKALTYVGTENNGKVSDFSGRYHYCDADNKVNVTALSGNETYFVYSRQESVATIAYEFIIPSQTVTPIQKLTYPTSYCNIENAPAGVIFAGWYDNSQTAGKPYDFSKEVFGNMTLYAKWYTMQDYNISASQVLSLGVTSVFPQNSGSFYFTALSDTTYTVYLKTESTSMVQNYTLININTGLTVQSGTLRDDTDYYVSFSVIAGELYRLELNSVGMSGKIEIKLNGAYPQEGGTFRNLIPYLDDFSITAVPFSDQTFLGWFDRDGNEASEYTTVSRSEYEIQYVLHNKSYSMKSFEIYDDIYLYGKFNYYSMKIINPEGESGQFRYYGDLSVGSEIELRATANDGFAFKEWMLYNPETGEISSFRTDYRFETDLRTAADLLYTPEMNVYKFRMLETDLIFVVTWSTSNDGTYESNSYTKYEISYEDAYINAPENRTVLYYTDPGTITEDRPYLSTSSFALSDPSRYETENGVSGYYIFEGWYYHGEGGKEISLYNSAKKQYIVDPQVAIGYAQTGKISIYAKWGEPVPEVNVYVDEITGQEYVLLGEYQSSYVDPISDAEEYAAIRRVASQDGYYYSADGTKKYYKYSDTMYFRMEKLRWDIIRKDNETVLIQAHELFITSQYNDTTNYNDGIYANNWEYSYLRQYLNGDFMTTIFNTFEINLIRKNAATVNNKPDMGNPAFDDTTRYPWVDQKNTEDYIYIFSYAEITNIMNGFNTSADAPCDLRQAGYTDYYEMILAGNTREGYYWLRSPGSNETTVFVVNENGRIVLDKNVSYAGYGIRPVIKLSAALVK